MPALSSIGRSARSKANEWPRVAIIVLALLSGNATARPSNSTSIEMGSGLTRVIGGEDVEPGEYPFLVSIDKACGGAIISPHHILTAGHCVDNYVSPSTSKLLTPVETMQVRVGAHYLSSVEDGQLVPIESIKIHEYYHIIEQNGPPINDIAILRTKSPMVFKGERFERGAVGSIDLPYGDDYIDGEMLTVAGWGMVNVTESGAKIIRPIPSKVSVPAVSIDKCRLTNSLTGDIDEWEYQLCAGIQCVEKDSCQGDSGGPLFRPIDEDTHELIGIVSFGPECGKRSCSLGVYTRVARYLNWIEANTLGVAPTAS